MNYRDSFSDTFTSHDEPVVVDNKPVRIDLSRKERPQQSGKTWTRKFSKFYQLVVMVVDKNEGFPPAQVIKLHESSPLVFSLNEGADSDTLTFEPSGSEALAMTSTLFDFEEGPQTDRRLTVKNGKKPRVVKITGRDAGNKPFEISLDGNPNRLFAAVIPDRDMRFDRAK